MRIEICGGIASGKTSLAKLLEEHTIGTVIYEDFKVNPFWEAFYNNPGEYIFETELTFTLQHYHEIKKRQYVHLAHIFKTLFYPQAGSGLPRRSIISGF